MNSIVFKEFINYVVSQSILTLIISLVLTGTAFLVIPGMPFYFLFIVAVPVIVTAFASAFDFWFFS